MVQIKWLKEAEIDLKQIYEFISQDSPTYARRQIEQIIDSTEILKKQILLGKIVPELNNPEIRQIIINHYRLIYRIVNKNEIHILYVHHGARNLLIRI